MSEFKPIPISTAAGEEKYLAWVREIQTRIARLSAGMSAKIENVESVVKEQAEDEGLWFIAKTAPEAYLQKALRHIHSVIEHERAIMRGHI